MTAEEWADKLISNEIKIIKEIQKESWNAALKEVDNLMRKPCWDLKLGKELKKLKK